MMLKRQEEEISEYAEEIANDQKGDNLTSIIFYEDNLVAKTFFTLKNYCRTVKLVESLRKSILKLILRRLFF